MGLFDADRPHSLGSICDNAILVGEERAVKEVSKERKRVPRRLCVDKGAAIYLLFLVSCIIAERKRMRLSGKQCVPQSASRRASRRRLVFFLLYSVPYTVLSPRERPHVGVAQHHSRSSE